MNADQSEHAPAGKWILVAFAWLAVGLPLLWGIWITFKKAIPLFR
jgi:hypothetical protein